ncbi:MAG: hypothetical protein J2P13_02105 [Acidobacteria bacterium]|nr:hypothetical protein [Acidobacteriota bacterium]
MMKTLVMKTPWLPALLAAAALSAAGAEIHAPKEVVAGNAAKLHTTGSGEGTFYLIGPASATKSKVEAGSDITLDSGRLEHAGRYVAILCASGGCASTDFFVTPAAANRLSFLVHPSRVPVGTPEGITAMAIVRDSFENIVLSPAPVTFTVMPKGERPVSARRTSQNGIAWARLTSAREEGATRLGASIGHADEIRVVQQVAADACNLRIQATRGRRGYLVETDPVHDCSGNPVPDGTIVSFTESDARGKTTVDVPIKRGIARVEMPIRGRAKITVASGVVTGNELEVSAR